MLSVSLRCLHSSPTTARWRYLDYRKPRSNLCRRQIALGDRFYIFRVDEETQLNACGETGAAGDSDSEDGAVAVSNSAQMNEKKVYEVQAV